MDIAKIDESQQLVFGWASIAADSDGQLIVDSHGDTIEPAELEKAVYEYVLDVRSAGELHKGDEIGQIVESVVMTHEKASAMGLQLPVVNGWWIGVKIADSEIFAKVKDGTYKMFSIEGTAVREAVE